MSKEAYYENAGDLEVRSERDYYAASEYRKAREEILRHGPLNGDRTALARIQEKLVCCEQRLLKAYRRER